MAIIQPKVFVELDPLDPVPEICAVMMALIAYQTEQEAAILYGVGKAIEDRRTELAKLKKGVEKDGDK